MAVEVRRRRADCDQADVHVEPVVDADHVAQQSPVLVNPVGGRLAEKANQRTRPKQPLGDRGGPVAVALRVEVDLGRVDLDEPHAGAVPEHDRVAVDDVIDPERGRVRSRDAHDGRKGRGPDGHGELVTPGHARPGVGR